MPCQSTLGKLVKVFLNYIIKAVDTYSSAYSFKSMIFESANFKSLMLFPPTYGVHLQGQLGVHFPVSTDSIVSAMETVAEFLIFTL